MQVIDALPPQLRCPPPRDPAPLAHLWSTLPVLVPLALGVLVPPLLLLLWKARLAWLVAGTAFAIAAVATALASATLRRIKRILVHGTVVGGRVEEVNAQNVRSSQNPLEPGYDTEKIQVAVRIGYVDPRGVRRDGWITYTTDRLGEIDAKGTEVAVFCDPADPRRFAAFLPSVGVRIH